MKPKQILTGQDRKQWEAEERAMDQTAALLAVLRIAAALDRMTPSVKALTAWATDNGGDTVSVTREDLRTVLDAHAQLVAALRTLTEQASGLLHNLPNVDLDMLSAELQPTVAAARAALSASQGGGK